MTRGEINNNPGNIRLSSQAFLGEVKPSKDKSFKQFVNVDYGYRALIKTLQTYQRSYGLKTIRGMIKRWAPSNENDTEAYIRRVCQDSGFKADEVIDMQRKDVAIKIARAISKVECSGWYDMSAAMRGFDLINS